MTAALKFVATENITAGGLCRDPEGPCPRLCGNTGTEGGNIALKNSAQKTRNPIKETFPPPFPLYYTIAHHVHKVYQTICFTCLERQGGVTGMG